MVDKKLKPLGDRVVVKQAPSEEKYQRLQGLAEKGRNRPRAKRTRARAQAQAGACVWLLPIPPRDELDHRGGF